MMKSDRTMPGAGSNPAGSTEEKVEAQGEDRKDFVDPSLAAPFFIVVLKAVLSTVVSFFTLEFLKKSWKPSEDDKK